MSAARLPSPPAESDLDLVWLLANKATLAAYLRRVAALDNLTINVVVSGVARSYPVQWSTENGQATIVIS